MSKSEFLSRMNTALKKLPDEERQDILSDYTEHFDIGIADGKSEAQISAAFGSPEQLAKELLADYHMEKAETSASAGNVLRAAFAVISLGFFNLIFVLVILIALAALIIAGWIVGLAFSLSPILVVVSAIVNPATFEMFIMFISFVLCGLGLLMLLGMRIVSKAAGNAFVRYLKFNMKIVKGGSRNEEN